MISKKTKKRRDQQTVSTTSYHIPNCQGEIAGDCNNSAFFSSLHPFKFLRMQIGNDFLKTGRICL